MNVTDAPRGAESVMALQSSQSNGVPDPIGAHTPNVARIYDYLLGGKDNFQVDGEATSAPGCLREAMSTALPRSV